MARRPTDYHRALFQRNGIPCPETRAEAAELVRSMQAVQRINVDESTIRSLALLVDEQKRQIAELRRLVRFQQIEIRRLQAGEDIP